MTPLHGVCAANPQAEQAEVQKTKLTETQWNLIEINGAPVAPGDPGHSPYIYLQEQGDKLSGSGGCNRLFGSFDLTGSSLQFHSVAQTMMACRDTSMAHESELTEALKLTTSFQIAEGVLQLKMDDRVLARFRARKQ
jgi:heat shock protein HslJ